MLYTWNEKQPDEQLDYQFDLSPAVNPSLDQITAANASVSPWGPGELSIGAFLISQQQQGSGDPIWLATLWLSGGVPGRTYTIKLQGVSAGTSPRPRIWEFLISVPVSAELMTWPPPPLVHSGFSEPLTWSAAPPIET